MQLYRDCPNGCHCGPWRPGIDVRLCVRCGNEVPDTDPLFLGIGGRPASGEPGEPDRHQGGAR